MYEALLVVERVVWIFAVSFLALWAGRGIWRAARRYQRDKEAVGNGMV